MNLLKLFIFLCLNILSCLSNNIGSNSIDQDVSKESQSQSVTITGKILPPEFMPSPPNWQADTQLILKGGLHKAFLREDGAFSFYNIPPGSYVLEVINPTFTYEPLRVEINSKGKIRARKVNYIQASQVIQVNYPLKMKPLGLTRYFQVREQWRITDFLFNPMVLMMVLPLLLLMVLPRMMNDPEARKEMEQLSNLTKYDMPEISEVMTSWFGGGTQQRSKPNQSKKKIKNS